MQVDQTIQQAEAIVRFTEEVDRRLAEFGIGGATELIAIYHQLRDALGRVHLSELEWAAQEMPVLQQRLQELGAELQHIGTLKAAFGVQH